MNASLALGARFVLALALASSAVAKLKARPTSRQQMQALVGERVGPFVESVLPVTELLVAYALVAWWSAVPGVMAVVLLAAFTVVLVRAQARHLPCPCFGGDGTNAPVGPSSVVRNGVLAALAVLAIGTPTGRDPWFTLAAVIGLGVPTYFAVRVAR